MKEEQMRTRAKVYADDDLSAQVSSATLEDCYRIGLAAGRQETWIVVWNQTVWRLQAFRQE